MELLIEPEESGVGVYVEDYDLVVDEDGYVVDVQEEERQDQDWVYGVTAPARSKWKPIPTAMPPMKPISA